MTLEKSGRKDETLNGFWDIIKDIIIKGQCGCEQGGQGCGRENCNCT